MKYSFLVSTMVVTALALPHAPVLKRQFSENQTETVDDTTILNFALTLEHLENAFYSEALGKFDEKAFTDAGLPVFARGRFAQVAAHEQAHVEFLSAALGDNATQPCTYKFPYTDPKSFAALSQVLEGVGVSAYAGVAKLITNKDYLTAAAVVLSTEARHSAWVSSAVNKFAAWSGAFDTPLGLNEVYTLAAQFIDTCPSGNPVLPVKAFPALNITGDATPGGTVQVFFEGINNTTSVSNSTDDSGNDAADDNGGDSTGSDNSSSTSLFATFFTGLNTEIVSVTNGSMTIPQDLRGQVYVLLTNDNATASDSNIVAGPAVLIFETNSTGGLVSSSTGGASTNSTTVEVTTSTTTSVTSTTTVEATSSSTEASSTTAAVTSG